MRFGHRFESRYYQKSTLSEGLIVAWPLDEASGTRYPDYGGTEFNLTDVNTVGTADAPTGIGGLCASMDGSTEYLYCVDPFPPPVGLTVSAWCYPTSVAATNKPFFQHGRSVANTFSFNFQVVTAAPTFNVSANGTAFTTATSGNVSVNTWYLLTAVWNGATIRAYTNLTAGTAQAFTGPLYNSSEVLAIGANSTVGTSAWWPGRIAQPLIWNRAITLADITYLHNSGNGRPLSDWL